MRYVTSKQQIHESKGVQEMNDTKKPKNGNSSIMAEEIYVKDDYKVFAFNLKDSEMKRLVSVYVEDPYGNRSRPKDIPRGDVLNKKNFANFLYNLDGNWLEEDISAISKKLKEFVRAPKPDMIQQDIFSYNIYDDLVEYIKNNVENPEDNPFANVIIHKRWGGCIRPNEFNKFVAGHPSKMKRIEILRWLEVREELVTDKERNDKEIKIKGRNIRFIVIKMPKDKIKKKKEAA